MPLDLTPFDFIERLKAHQSVDAVLADLRQEAAKVGLDYFIMTGLPMPQQPLQPLVMASAWPEGWFERYNEHGYFHHDGVGQWALRTTEPFRWTEVPVPLAKPKMARQVMNEATEFGMSDGFLVPMFSARHWQAAVAFGASQPCDMSERSQSAIHLMAIYAANRARRLLGDVPAPRRMLTPREAECLTWIAAGKTVEDVATILNLSGLTVQTHLRNVRTKMDVATIAQAVAEGIRAGEIRI